MTVYNVDVEVTVTVVVQTESEKEAVNLAGQNWGECFLSSEHRPSLQVTGEATCAQDPRDGWDMFCVPYGGKERLGKILEFMG